MATYTEIADPSGKYDKLNGYTPGYNGLSGFKTWECYMLLKYGHQNSFGRGRPDEYLIELPIYPESVSESIDANWQQQTVLGRSSPLAAYGGTSLKRVNFSLELHRDFLTGSFSHTTQSLEACGGSIYKQAAGEQIQSGRGPFNTRSWYVSINKMLQMSCYPQYTDYGIVPPTTYFIFGQMILKGFVESYQTSWKKPIINTFYAWNTVDIGMMCYPDTIISADEMFIGAAGNSGATSTQNTYNTRFPNNSAEYSDVMKGNFERYNLRTSSALGGNILDT